MQFITWNVQKLEKMIKDAYRNYTKKEHWNLDAEYINPLKEFLEKNLK